MSRRIVHMLWERAIGSLKWGLASNLAQLPPAAPTALETALGADEAAMLINRLCSDQELVSRIRAAVALARRGFLPEPCRVLTAIGLPGLPVGADHRTILHALAAQYSVEMAELTFADSLRPIRPSLVEALGAARDPGAVSCLALHGADSDPRVRLAALRAACEIADPTAARWVAQLLGDAAQSVVVKAIHTCVELGNISALPHLHALTRHDSWWVRTRADHAIIALSQRSRPDIAAAHAA